MLIHMAWASPASCSWCHFLSMLVFLSSSCQMRSKNRVSDANEVWKTCKEANTSMRSYIISYHRWKLCQTQLSNAGIYQPQVTFHRANWHLEKSLVWTRLKHHSLRSHAFLMSFLMRTTSPRHRARHVTIRGNMRCELNAVMRLSTAALWTLWSQHVALIISKLSIWRIGSSILSCYQVSSPSTQTHPFFCLSLHVTKPSHCFPLSEYHSTIILRPSHFVAPINPPQVLVLTAYYNQRSRAFVMSDHRVSLSVLHVPFLVQVFPPTKYGSSVDTKSQQLRWLEFRSIYKTCCTQESFLANYFI